MPNYGLCSLIQGSFSLQFAGFPQKTRGLLAISSTNGKIKRISESRNSHYCSDPGEDGIITWFVCPLACTEGPLHIQSNVTQPLLGRQRQSEFHRRNGPQRKQEAFNMNYSYQECS